MEVESDSGARQGVRLIVAYDGTAYCGFQLQLSDPTVQAELERAAERMTGHPVRIRAASRTDSGVHALGQVASFESARHISARGWMLGLNRHLPDDIRIQQAEHCPLNYDPRFDSLGKRYRYLLQTGEAKNPLLRHRAWQTGHRPLNVAKMKEAATLLVGTHDFRAFKSADDQRPNTVRTVWSMEVRSPFADDTSLIAIDVHGNAFMKNMVRIFAGTLLDVAIGRVAVADVQRMLGADARREDAGRTAPAHGLVLLEVALGRLALQASMRPPPDEDD